jgi:CheY-like chemotaxis protein
MAKDGPILLIDDDRDECELLEDVLRQQNISNELRCFSNGREAIDYLLTTTDKPFLILCDMNMPVMNGIEVRKQINDDPYLRKKSIPFVFYTTAANSFSIHHAYEMSVQGFFIKDYDMKKIGMLIHTIYTYWQLCENPNN